MNRKTIELEALHLPKEERALLIRKLLVSLDVSSEQEVMEDWMKEVQRRVRDIDSGKVKAVSSEEVRQKAQVLLH